MNQPVEKAASWMYEGVWGILTGWFRVPKTAPTLPVNLGEFIQHFHPSRNYLSCLKLYFWIGLTIIDLLLLAAWIAIFFASATVGWILALPFLVVTIGTDVLAYLAIHLRYDTMWYVMTDRSLRCRRGIWTILEHTITFENVQNVEVHRGPIQYFFGISTIVVETAGASEGEQENKFAVGNKAIMEGIADPDTIRQQIMDRVRQSKSTGLGEVTPTPPSTGSMAWNDESLQVLRDIRDAVQSPTS